MRKTVSIIASAAVLLAARGSVQGDIIAGQIFDWAESGPIVLIGDGTNHVRMFWSINTFDRGFFYGSGFTADSDVAHAAGVTDVSQITDASIYAYTSGAIGALCDADCGPGGVGEFVVWRNNDTGHYGVMRIDDIHTDGNLEDAVLDGSWWFQTDGTGNFSGKTPCGWDCGDDDGNVGTADLLALLAAWGGPGPCDFDGDGTIGTAELLKLLANWGSCP